MNTLFLHPVFPGQFHKLMEHLAKDPNNQIVHCCFQSKLRAIPGVKKIVYQLPPEATEPVPPFLKKFKDSVWHGQAILKVLQKLKDEGFVPDLIFGYAGWGPTLFVQDFFPNTPLLCYFEWFLNAHGFEHDFDPAHSLSLENENCLKLQNAEILIDLHQCDWGITPTHWQKQAFPEAFHHKMTVLHDGVDTDLYKPRQNAKLILPELGLDLSEAKEIVTYVSRGLEPFRGFPQFIKAVEILQKKRPECHVVIVGSEDVFYSKKPDNGNTYKSLALETTCLDMSRIHFTGWLDESQYRQVLQASTVHVYLTYPYVLSWSLMEALSTGCIVVASKTPPVEEVIAHGVNGFLTDFFSPEAIADSIEQALASSKTLDAMRKAARETIVNRYSLDTVMPQYVGILENLMNKERMLT